MSQPVHPAWRQLAAGVLVMLACSGCAAQERTATPSRPADDAVPVATTPSDEPAPAGTEPVHTPQIAGTAAVIARVVDGDTINLASGAKVRLVQIDTPETHGGTECGGPPATAVLRAQLPVGTRVRLVADPMTDNADRYGRLLRYVYVGRRNLNVWMVARGHAAPYFYDGEQGRFAAQLTQAAIRARAANIGFWGACPNAVLDARRGVNTGALGAPSSTSDAAAGAAAVARPAASIGLPLAPSYPPDVDCADLPGPVRVTPDDPHRLDRDGDGIGCDS